MIKLFIGLILSITLFITPVFSQTWHTANQVTVTWDAVTTNSDGNPLSTTDPIKYQVYSKLAPSGTEDKVGTEITTLSQTVSFSSEGSYYLGVKAIRYIGTEKVGESAIAWSSDPLVCYNNQAFGVRYWLPPAQPKGLKLGG
jgi:hypothetical protein